MCLSGKSRHLKAYKHKMNLGSVVLNFSSLLPSGLMRQENSKLDLEFSKPVHQREKALLKILQLKSLPFGNYKVFMKCSQLILTIIALLQ